MSIAETFITSLREVKAGTLKTGLVGIPHHITSDQGTPAGTMEDTACYQPWLAFSASFPVQDHPLRGVVPTVGWALLHQLSVKADSKGTPAGQPGLGRS